MSRPARPTFPRTQRSAEALGARLKLARLRRRVTETEMAGRVGVSRPTIRRLEAGALSVSLGVLARVLAVLALDDQLDAIAHDDVLGERLNDSRLTRPRRSADRTLADEL